PSPTTRRAPSTRPASSPPPSRSSDRRLHRHHHRRHDGNHGIDLAPMLDFVLNLLIFFIITTSFVKEAGVVVSRPNADTVQYKESGNILIAFRENSEISLYRKQVDPPDLRNLVGRTHVERRDSPARLLGD